MLGSSLLPLSGVYDDHLQHKDRRCATVVFRKQAVYLATHSAYGVRHHISLCLKLKLGPVCDPIFLQVFLADPTLGQAAAGN